MNFASAFLLLIPILQQAQTYETSHLVPIANAWLTKHLASIGASWSGEEINTFCTSSVKLFIAEQAYLANMTINAIQGTKK